MARKLNRLTAVEVRANDKKGMYHGSEDRPRVAAQSVTPLFPVLRIPPAVVMSIEIGRCTSVKGHAPGCLELFPAAVFTPSFDRVDSVKAHASALGCAFACVS
jgi:hypothetical protein